MANKLLPAVSYKTFIIKQFQMLTESSTIVRYISV